MSTRRFSLEFQVSAYGFTEVRPVLGGGSAGDLFEATVELAQGVKTTVEGYLGDGAVVVAEEFAGVDHPVVGEVGNERLTRNFLEVTTEGRHGHGGNACGFPDGNVAGEVIQDELLDVVESFVAVGGDLEVNAVGVQAFVILRFSKVAQYVDEQKQPPEGIELQQSFEAGRLPRLSFGR